jgi:hypothetical protein
LTLAERGDASLPSERLPVARLAYAGAPSDRGAIWGVITATLATAEERWFDGAPEVEVMALVDEARALLPGKRWPRRLRREVRDITNDLDTAGRDLAALFGPRPVV